MERLDLWHQLLASRWDRLRLVPWWGVRGMSCPAANAWDVFKLVALTCTVSASVVGCSAGFSAADSGFGG